MAAFTLHAGSLTASAFAGKRIRSQTTVRPQVVSTSRLMARLTRHASRPSRLTQVPAQGFSTGIYAKATGVTGSGPERPLWLPGGAVPKHLTGDLPGDYGFDPLKLGADKQALAWYQQAELVHSRYAMTAVAGILIPGLLNKIHVLNVPEWFDAGKVSIQNSYAPFKSKRWMDFRKPGSQTEENSFLGFESQFKGESNGYPGGLYFDPLGFSRGSKESLQEYKVKEIKNGRLAMLAFLGFAAQYLATGKGPLDNLVDHLANPAAINFTTNGVSLPGIPFMQP